MLFTEINATADTTVDTPSPLAISHKCSIITYSDADEILRLCCVGLLVTATSLDGVAVNGTLVRFAQRHEHHDSKQPVLVVFSEQNTVAADDTGECPLNIHQVLTSHNELAQYLLLLCDVTSSVLS